MHRRIAGRYELVEEIGNGPCSEVWKAIDANTRREVVVKLVEDYSPACDGPDPCVQSVQRFGSIPASSGLAPILDCGRDGRLRFVVSEFYSRNLAGQIQRGLPTNVAAWTELAEQVVRPLAHLHAAGLAHGNVKPSNYVFPGAGDVPVLTDPGFTVGSEDMAAHGPTRRIEVASSWYATAPESARGSGASNPAADVYAAGVLLFHIGTGEAPFKGSYREILAGHFSRPAPDPRTINPKIPAWFARIVLRALEKSPEARFANAGEMYEELRSARSPGLARRIGASKGVQAGLFLAVVAAALFAADVPAKVLRAVSGSGTGEAAVSVSTLPGEDVRSNGMVPQGSLDIHTSPSFANVKVVPLSNPENYKALTAPYELVGLEEDWYEITVHRPGFFASVDTVYISENCYNHSIQLEPKVRLEMHASAPDTRFWIGESELGVGQSFGIDVSPGYYRVRAAAAGRPLSTAPFDTTVALDPTRGNVELLVSMGSRTEAAPAKKKEQVMKRGTGRAAAKSRSTRAKQEELEESVQSALRSKSWAEAEQSLEGLLKLAPKHPDEDRWRSWIDAGRRTPNGTNERLRFDVERTLRLYEQAKEALDIPGYLRLFSTVSARERSSVETRFARATGMKIEISEIEIDISGHRARVRFLERSVVRLANGSSTRRDDEQRMHLARMTSGEWLILAIDTHMG